MQNLDNTSTESIIIELANEGYGFGFSLAAGEDGHSVIKCLIPDGIAERVSLKFNRLLLVVKWLYVAKVMVSTN